MLIVYYIGFALLSLGGGFTITYLPRRKGLPEETHSQWAKVNRILGIIWIGGGAFVAALFGFFPLWIGLGVVFGTGAIGLIAGQLWPIQKDA